MGARECESILKPFCSSSPSIALHVSMFDLVVAAAEFLDRLGDCDSGSDDRASDQDHKCREDVLVADFCERPVGASDGGLGRKVPAQYLVDLHFQVWSVIQ